MRVRVLILFSIIPLILLIAAISIADFARAVSPLKMEKALAKLTEFDGPQSAIWAEQNDIHFRADARSADVIVEPQVGVSTAVLAEQLRAHQAIIESESASLIRMRIPIEHLRNAAALESVAFIRRSYTARPLKLAENRGVLQTGAQLFHSYGFQGENIRIAVIDGGFEGLSDAIRAGNLPADAIAEMIDYTGDGLEVETEHGLEVAQIVHEMAPAAQLILMRVVDEVDLERAVDDAIRLQARVISHSIGWFDSNFGDGKGLVDQIAEKATRAGILWVNAAGNQAQGHWMGYAPDDNGNQWVEFAPDLESIEIWTAFPGLIDLVLVWEGWPISYQDFDLYLTDWKDQILGSSEEDQNGLAPPRELITYFAEQPGTYKIKVKARHVSKPTRIKIFSMEHDLFPFVSEGSVMAPADCACALAVGAVSVFQWDEGMAEYFSAQGPTSDGRIKPDLMAPDRIRDFPGTSASAPHVAGAAAVLLSQHPLWDVDTLHQALESQTEDIYQVGKDNISGYGKMQLKLANPQGTRTLSASRVSAGDEITVTLSARMAASQFGSLEWVEEIPKALSVLDIDPAGGTIEFQKDSDPVIIRWRWTSLGPGDSRLATYRLVVPVGTPASKYALTGRLNGQAISGPATIEVDSKSQSSQLENHVLITPRVTSHTIQLRWNSKMPSEITALRIELFNSSGQRIAKSDLINPQHATMNIEHHWANGVYFYRVSLIGFSGEILSQEIKKLALLR